MNSRRVSWKDWPKLKDLLGLRVVEVIMEDHAETTIVVDGPRESLLSIGNDLYLPKNQKKLAGMLAELLNQAERMPGDPKRTTLPGGLRIDAIYGLDVVIRLQISREKVAPSNQEWATVLNHLPEGLQGNAEPERFEHKGAFYMRSELWKG